MSDDEQPVVLVIEDEPDVATSYELWLDREYEIRVAEDGSEGLAALDDTVDVVLLDRMMPGMPGQEVLERIRESDHDPQVAMVTAVDPGFEVVEMGFDDYITKPPTREGLVATVEELVERADYADRVQAYRRLVAKRSALEASKPRSELTESQAYDELTTEIEALERELDEDTEALLDDETFVGRLRDLTGGDGQ